LEVAGEREVGKAIVEAAVVRKRLPMIEVILSSARHLDARGFMEKLYDA
jgi:hypothetical protein